MISCMASDIHPAGSASILKRKGSRLGAAALAFFMLGLVFAVFVLCVAVGSVPVPFLKTASIIFHALSGQPLLEDTQAVIILSVRLPRVLNVLLSGASLALCGAVMQGLLRNPLADGGTLGVSAGASLGAMLAILLGISVPALPLAGTAVMAVVFAFLSMMLILSLAFALDRSLATGTIILIGIIFTMFISSLMNLIIAFSGPWLRTITFWTMGSLTGSGYRESLLLTVALLLCGAVLLTHAKELDAFSLGEENARHIGVSVRRVRLGVMVAVSALIGVCVSIGGSIGFVGLVIPHIARLLTGPSHRRLLPASLFLGAVFLMLCDLLARTILSPLELPLGVVTSLIGAIFFVVILSRSRRRPT